MEVVWLIAGFGVGAFGMWTILQVQGGNNFGINLGGSSSGDTPTSGQQSVADGPPAPSDSTGNFTPSDANSSQP
jgi:hypothetical protein